MTLRDRLLSHRYCQEEGEPPCDLAGWDSACDGWERCAFPSIRLSHRLAASLACTSAADLDPTACEPPWPTFYVHVPTDLLVGKHGPVTGLLFECKVGGVQILFDQGESWHAHTSARSLAELCREFEVKWDPTSPDVLAASAFLNAGGSGDRMSEETRRTATCVRRLAIGIILELSTTPLRELIALGPPRKRPSKRRSDLPTTWDFKLTRDVRLDVRAEVTAFCLGTKGTSPTVQVLVRGHYKRQPCGPGGLERRWIHIEPYWRGPEDAPIGVRSHVLVDGG